MSKTSIIMLLLLICTMMATVGILAVAVAGGFGAASSAFRFCGLVSMILHIAYFRAVMNDSVL